MTPNPEKSPIGIAQRWLPTPGGNRHLQHPSTRKQRKTQVRDEARIRGQLPQAAAAHPLQERPIRQPPRPVQERPARAAGRRTERAGVRHHKRTAAQDNQARRARPLSLRGRNGSSCPILDIGAVRERYLSALEHRPSEKLANEAGVETDCVELPRVSVASRQGLALALEHRHMV